MVVVVVVVVAVVVVVVVVVAVVVVVIVVVRAEAEGLLRSPGGQRVVVADAELRLVAVERAAVEVAVVAGDLHRPDVGRGDVGAALHEAQPVLGLVGEREHRGPGDVEQLHRGGRVAGQEGVGPGDADAGVHAPVPVADVRERLRHLRGGLDAPPFLGEVRHAPVERPRSVAGAVLGGGRQPAERAPGELPAEPAVVEPVLQVEGEGAAEGVQAVGRVGSGGELDAVEGELRHEVELDRVAERLVDAHAVLVHGDALRQAEQRRGGEAAKAERRLEEVRGHAFEGHRPEALVQRVGHRGRAARREIAAVDDGYRRRHAVAIDADSRQRGDPDHVDLLGDRRHGQHHVDDARLAGGDLYARPALRLEAGQGDGDGVGAGLEGQHVHAARIRRPRDRWPECRLRRDRGSRCRGSLRVGDRAGQRSGLRRRARRRADAEHGRPDEGEPVERVPRGAASPRDSGDDGCTGCWRKIHACTFRCPAIRSAGIRAGANPVRPRVTMRPSPAAFRTSSRAKPKTAPATSRCARIPRPFDPAPGRV